MTTTTTMPRSPPSSLTTSSALFTLSYFLASMSLSFDAFPLLPTLLSLRVLAPTFSSHATLLPVLLLVTLQGLVLL